MVSYPYEDKILGKVLHFIQSEGVWLDLFEIYKAISFAKLYHAGQVRDSGEPYYSHPLEVASMVADYLPKTEIIITAILHDTIEDTDATFEIIAEEFGEQIARNVMDLTRIKEGGREISSSEMLDILYQEGKYEILLVKLFDRLHNIQTIQHKSPEKIRKVINETISKFLMLSCYLEQKKIEDDLYSLAFKAVFKDEELHPRNTQDFYDH